jgi:very-short-patch-repair endonuclease
MPVRYTVIGQNVKEEIAQRARELRREMTLEERILWQRLRTNRLGGFHFRRQQAIEHFIVDFYCHAAALIVEVDGSIHQQQAEYDAERDRILTARGFRVMRVRNEDVERDLEGVLERIEAACGEGST